MKTDKLKTVQNFAREYNYSTVYIYRLIKKNIIKSIEIDGVKFVDINSIPENFNKKAK